jgi:pyruvate-formate lyase-activating enzyme
MTLSTAPRINCDVIETRADRARIFNLQRYSLNDGQGIRTVVFFKGCPHTCPWCANPESLSPKIETVRGKAAVSTARAASRTSKSALPAHGSRLAAMSLRKRCSKRS